MCKLRKYSTPLKSAALAVGHYFNSAVLEAPHAVRCLGRVSLFEAVPLTLDYFDLVNCQGLDSIKKEQELCQGNHSVVQQDRTR